jgi:hypothetical protein
MKKPKKRQSISNFFWRNCIFWGAGIGILFGGVGVLLGSLEPNKMLPFGLLGFGLGFVLGFVLKAIDKLPPRQSVFLSRGNYIGGNRMPDVGDVTGVRKKR